LLVSDWRYDFALSVEGEMRILPCPNCIGGKIVTRYGVAQCINCGYEPGVEKELEELRKQGVNLKIRTGWKTGRPRRSALR